MSLVDFKSGRGLRVHYHGILVLRNEKEKNKPWTVIHLNDEGIDDYYVGLHLSDEQVKDWPKLTYLMS